MPSYDAILFDFDGVLVDTEPLHWKVWSEVLRPDGVRMDWDLFAAHCIGIADPELLRFFASLAPAPLSDEHMERRYAEKRALYRRTVAAHLSLPAATTACLRSLDGLRLAVVTSSEAADVTPVLRNSGVLECFGAIVARDDVPRRKPAPDPYLIAAARLGARFPLVVEDSDAGEAAARAAGFDCLRLANAEDLPSALAGALGLEAAIPDPDLR